MDQLALAAEIFSLLARCSERLNHIAQEVRGLPNVLQVCQRLEFRDYRSGSLLEGFVDAELSDGTAKTLWFELSWASKEWALQSSVLAMGHDGVQEIVREFPTVKIRSLQEFQEGLEGVIRRLESSLQLTSE
jgi:hypothetical protein